MRGSGQRLPITLRFTRVLGTFSHTTCFPFSCALWACFSDRSVSGERSEPIGALMPHAALFVVQPCMVGGTPSLRLVSMPHAALCVVQLRLKFSADFSQLVSMPHAALWVVQQNKMANNYVPAGVSMPHAALWVVQTVEELQKILGGKGFQCRTRLCGWCSFFRS